MPASISRVFTTKYQNTLLKILKLSLSSAPITLGLGGYASAKASALNEESIRCEARQAHSGSIWVFHELCWAGEVCISIYGPSLQLQICICNNLRVDVGVALDKATLTEQAVQHNVT